MADKEFDYARARDRAAIFTNTVLGIVEDAAKAATADAIEVALKHIRTALQDTVTDAVESVLFAARTAIANALRDEFVDLERQVISENRPNNRCNQGWPASARQWRNSASGAGQPH